MTLSGDQPARVERYATAFRWAGELVGWAVERNPFPWEEAQESGDGGPDRREQAAVLLSYAIGTLSERDGVAVDQVRLTAVVWLFATGERTRVLALRAPRPAVQAVPEVAGQALAVLFGDPAREAEAEELRVLTAGVAHIHMADAAVRFEGSQNPQVGDRSEVLAGR